jgi:hypothetical protein
VSSVLDGDLDEFIKAFLVSQARFPGGASAPGARG